MTLNLSTGKKRHTMGAFLVLFSLLPYYATLAGEMRHNTKSGVADYFDKAKNDSAILTAFIHKMPKGGNLHIALKSAGEANAATEIRRLFTRAVNQRLSYVEIVVEAGAKPWLRRAENMRREVLLAFAQQGVLWELEAGYVLSVASELPASVFEKAVGDAMREAMNPESPVCGVTILTRNEDWMDRIMVEKLAIVDTLWGEYNQRHHQFPASNPPPPAIDIQTGDGSGRLPRYETTRNRNMLALELGHATRLGGGDTAMWEDDPYALLKRLREERLAVEIHFGRQAVDGDTVPFRFFWEAGAPVVLCSADVSGESLLTETYVAATKAFDLSYMEIKWLAFNGLEYAHLQGESFFLDGDFNRPRPDGMDVISQSRKAYLQLTLLNAFAEFETEMEGIVTEMGRR